MFLHFIFFALCGAAKSAIVGKPSPYPVAIRNVVSKMTQCCQKALESRISRMEVELPPGVDWGVEIKKANGNSPPNQGGNIEKIKKSNREAARLFTEMFSVLSTTTVVLFPTELEASEARIAWGQSFKGQVLSFDAPTKSAKGYSKLRSRRFTPEEQEAVLMASDGVYVPEGCEVLLIAGPRAKDYKSMRKISERQGDGLCIVNINGRAEAVRGLGQQGEDEDPVSSSSLAWYDAQFTPVFHYCPPALSTKASQQELLLYKEFQGKWLLGAKAGAGDKEKEKGGALGALVDKVKSLTESPFVTLGEWEGARPTQDQIIAAIASTTLK